jgi:hypothetical protein
MARRTVDDESWERLIEVATEFGLRHPDAVLVGLGQFKGVETGLRQLRRSAPRWRDWGAVREQLRRLAVALMEALTEDQ